MFQLVSPGLPGSLAGTVILSVTGLPCATASVEFFVGSHFLGRSVTPPFSFTLNTTSRLLVDGEFDLSARALALDGRTQSEATLTVRVNNGTRQTRIVSPASLSALSGVVPITVDSSDPTAFVAIHHFTIDGIVVARVFTDVAYLSSQRVIANLDTTRFSNGPHELAVTFHSNLPTNEYFNDRGMIVRTITITNPPSNVTAIRAERSSIEVVPGGSETLSCVAELANGSTMPCSGPVTWTTTSSAISVVGPVVTGISEGYGAVTVSAHGRDNVVHVFSRASANVPHFGRDGTFLNAWDPAKSLFVVTPFGLQGRLVVSGTPAFQAEIKRAGINSLSEGAMNNPRNPAGSYAQWQQEFDTHYATAIAPAADAGYSFYFTGDDLAREKATDAWFMLNWPSAPTAIGYMQTRYKALGAAIAIDVVDEGSALWGDDPTPNLRPGAPRSFVSITCANSLCTVLWPGHTQAGRRFALTGSSLATLNTPQGSTLTAINSTASTFQFVPLSPVAGVFDVSTDPNLEYQIWADTLCSGAPCNPRLTNRSLATISAYLHAPSQRLAVSWPGLGDHSVEVHDRWMGKTAFAAGFSDFASHYWATRELRNTYAWSGGIKEFTNWMAQLYFDRQNSVVLSRPQIMLGHGSGIEYIKRVAGTQDFTAGVDEVSNSGSSFETMVPMIIESALLGTAGVRIYQFDYARDARLTAPVGTYVQTGLYPTGPEQAQFRAIAFGSRPLNSSTLQPFVLGKRLSAPSLDSALLTSLRETSIGRALMILNTLDSPRRVTVPFASIPAGLGPITRYRLFHDRVVTSRIDSAQARDDVFMRPGEALVYVAPTGPAALGMQSVRVTVPDRRARYFLRIGYFYSDMLDEHADAIDCTNGCDAAVDRSLGDVFYQFVYVDRDGVPRAKSPAMALPSVNSLVAPASPIQVL